MEERNAVANDHLLMQQPGWRKKILQLNMQKINEESKLEGEDRVGLSPMSMKKKTTFDNITIKRDESLLKRINDSHPFSASVDGPVRKSIDETGISKIGIEEGNQGQEELLQVLNQINQSLIN